jgi:hypothetical protein
MEVNTEFHPQSIFRNISGAAHRAQTDSSAQWIIEASLPAF